MKLIKHPSGTEFKGEVVVGYTHLRIMSICRIRKTKGIVSLIKVQTEK